MIRFLLLFASVAAAISLVWYAAGRPVPLPKASLASGDRLNCLSYAPFRGEQAPFMPHLAIPERQVDADLAQLAKVTSCVRTYSSRGPQAAVAKLARKYGMTVLQGIWIGRSPAENRREIEDGLRLARVYPDTVRALIVGNETLLRGELGPARIKAYLAEVRDRATQPATYADVWEFWIKAPELAEAADFITIHILPYWEDKPVRATEALQHVREIRAEVQAEFPDHEILIGEVGWPSAGRMRDGALPSPANQALVLEGVAAAAQREGWKVNLIEAYDQPWKRLLEGTVGGYWGLFSAHARDAKFRFGEPVSNQPHWRLIAGIGIVVAFYVFLSGWLGASARRVVTANSRAVALIALTAGLVAGWAGINLPMESPELGDRFRSVLLFVLAIVVPGVAAYSVARGEPLYGLAAALNIHLAKRRDWPERILVVLLAATVVAAIHVALGLVFDPRYKDFPLAPLTAAIVSLAIVAFSNRAPSAGSPGASELALAATLCGSAMFIVVNESAANWQAVWLSLLLVLLGLTTVRARPAQD